MSIGRSTQAENSLKNSYFGHILFLEILSFPGAGELFPSDCRADVIPVPYDTVHKRDICPCQLFCSECSAKGHSVRESDERVPVSNAKRRPCVEDDVVSDSTQERKRAVPFSDSCFLFGVQVFEYVICGFPAVSGVEPDGGGTMTAQVFKACF